MFQRNGSASYGENLTVIYILSVIYVLTIAVALLFQNTSTNIYIIEMSKKRYTAEKPAELLTLDNDPGGNDLESSSEDDLPSIGEDENQSILSNSDSGDTEASLISSVSESEDDDELKYFDTFWLFLGYRDIIIVIFI